MNARLDELQAALLRVLLPRLDAANARRAGDRRRPTRRAWRGSGRSACPRRRGHAAVRGTSTSSSTRAATSWRPTLARAGIGTAVHYRPAPHLTTAFRADGWAPGDFPVAERHAETALSLPMHPGLSDAEVERVTRRSGRLLRSTPDELPMHAALVQRVRIAWFRRRGPARTVAGAPAAARAAVLAGHGHDLLRERRGVRLGAGPRLPERLHATSRRATPGRASTLRRRARHLNNGVMIVSEGPGISIGRRCLSGRGVTIYDSDFHSLGPGPGTQAPRAWRRWRSSDDVFLGTGAI